MLKEACTRRLFIKRTAKAIQGVILSIGLFYRKLLFRSLYSVYIPLNLVRGIKNQQLKILNQQSQISIGRYFEGEELKYKIGFWWFKDAAIGRISFKRKKDGGYIAIVEAETLGFIGWLTRYRRDVYYAHMEAIDGGRRLRTYLFEKVVTIGKKIRQGYIRLDYTNRVMDWKSWGGGSPEKGAVEPIPYGMIYDDPIVVFYNFRYGSYGGHEKGKEISVATFPKDGRPSNITLRIATEEEKKRRLGIYSGMDRIEYLVDLKVDAELIDSRAGEIEILMAGDLLPVYGVVKDVFFFGDVRGRLID